MDSFEALASFGSQTAQCEDAPERALHFGQTHAVAVAPGESPFRLAPERLAPFEAVVEDIRAALRARSEVAASARYVGALASSANIEGLALLSGAPS